MRIEADNLDDAFLKAAKELNCSVTQLDIQIIQHPSSGLLGFFKKTAIIDVVKEGEARAKKTKQKEVKQDKKENKKEAKESKKAKKESQKPSIELSKAIKEIEKGVKKLVKTSCYNMETVSVKAYNDETVLIELDGEDAALLIGKEGYRYKAFSYLLYNWINIKYGFGIRLEIAQFLKNQEISARKYITPVIERIHSNGRGQTKPLDGVWIKIALEILRKEFPEKYVGIKTGKEGAKYIVVNDFNKK